MTREQKQLIKAVDTLIETLENMTEEEFTRLSIEAKFEIYALNQLLEET